MSIKFIPFKKVGPFVLGDKVKYYINKHNFIISKGHESTNWDCYELVDEGIELYVEDDIVVSIACRKECYLNGFNLIGMNYHTFLDKFSLPENREHDSAYMASDDDYQDIYEVDEMGVQIWCKKDKIVTVFCSPHLEEGD